MVDFELKDLRDLKPLRISKLIFFLYSFKKMDTF